MRHVILFCAERQAMSMSNTSAGLKTAQMHASQFACGEQLVQIGCGRPGVVGVASLAAMVSDAPSLVSHDRPGRAPTNTVHAGAATT